MINVKERFVKIGNRTYFESELRTMKERELRSIVLECQKGIEEIERKKADYIMVNESEYKDDEHYKEVIARFSSASIYLQADIILIENIIKERDSEDKDYEWLETFYNVARDNMLTWKFSKLENITSEKVGYNFGR